MPTYKRSRDLETIVSAPLRRLAYRNVVASRQTGNRSSQDHHSRCKFKHEISIERFDIEL